MVVSRAPALAAASVPVAARRRRRLRIVVETGVVARDLWEE